MSTIQILGNYFETLRSKSSKIIHTHIYIHTHYKTLTFSKVIIKQPVFKPTSLYSVWVWLSKHFLLSCFYSVCVVFYFCFKVVRQPVLSFVLTSVCSPHTSVPPWKHDSRKRLQSHTHQNWMTDDRWRMTDDRWWMTDVRQWMWNVALLGHRNYDRLTVYFIISVWSCTVL